MKQKHIYIIKPIPLNSTKVYAVHKKKKFLFSYIICDIFYFRSYTLAMQFINNKNKIQWKLKKF